MYQPCKLTTTFEYSYVRREMHMHNAYFFLRLLQYGTSMAATTRETKHRVKVTDPHTATITIN